MLLRILALLVLLCALPVQAAPGLRMLVSDAGGLIREGAGGRPEGRAVDTLRLLLERAHVDARVELMPRARAIDLISKVPHTCLAGVARVPDNAQQFKWVGPVLRNDLILYSLADHPGSLQKVADLHGHPIASVRGSVVSRLLRDMGLKVDEGVDLAMNLRKLSARRVEFLALGQVEWEAMRQEAGSPPLKPMLKLLEMTNYIACHPSVDEQSLRQIQQTIDTLRQAGHLRFLGL